jgi:hypothetical protein
MTSAQDLDGRLGEPRHGHQATSIQISALFTPTLVKGVPVAGSVPRMLVLQMKRCLPPAPRPCGRTAERSTSFTWARPGVVPIDVQVDLDAEDARGVVGDVRSLAPRARG